MNNLPSGQSSPGSVHSVQQLSKGIRQMPQLSSFAIHRQVATLTQSEKQNSIELHCILCDFDQPEILNTNRHRIKMR